MSFTILVLGGYGNFGKKISATLAKSANINLIIAGRNPQKAAAFVCVLQQQNVRPGPSVSH